MQDIPKQQMPPLSTQTIHSAVIRLYTNNGFRKPNHVIIVYSLNDLLEEYQKISGCSNEEKWNERFHLDCGKFESGWYKYLKHLMDSPAYVKFQIFDSSLTKYAPALELGPSLFYRDTVITWDLTNFDEPENQFFLQKEQKIKMGFLFQREFERISFSPFTQTGGRFTDLELKKKEREENLVLRGLMNHLPYPKEEDKVDFEMLLNSNYLTNRIFFPNIYIKWVSKEKK